MKRVTTLLVFLFSIAMLMTTMVQVNAQEEESSSPLDI